MRERLPEPAVVELAPEALAAAEREGLCEAWHLELFTLWWSWSAFPNAPTLAELWRLFGEPGSGALIQDLRQILRWMGAEQESETFLRRQREERKKHEG